MKLIKLRFKAYYNSFDVAFTIEALDLELAFIQARVEHPRAHAWKCLGPIA